jgi:hypothetical protein
MHHLHPQQMWSSPRTLFRLPVVPLATDQSSGEHEHKGGSPHDARYLYCPYVLHIGTHAKTMMLVTFTCLISGRFNISFTGVAVTPCIPRDPPEPTIMVSASPGVTCEYARRGMSDVNITSLHAPQQIGSTGWARGAQASYVTVKYCSKDHEE